MPEVTVNAAHHAVAMVLQMTGIVVRLPQEAIVHEAIVSALQAVVHHLMTTTIEVTDDVVHPGDTMGHHHLGGMILIHMIAEDHHHLHEDTVIHMHEMEIRTLVLEAHLAMEAMALEEVVEATLPMKIVVDTRTCADDFDFRMTGYCLQKLG